MLRTDGVMCGTTTTSTGTLTLAACPAPPGGLDPYQAFSGMGLGTSVATPCTYEILEYTDQSFTTLVKQEKGVGALLLGASLVLSTLARTTVQQTVTGMNTSTPAMLFDAPSALSIGVAANTLVIIGPSALDIPAFSPYFENTIQSWGVMPVGLATTSTFTLLAADVKKDYYFPIVMLHPILAKKISIWVPNIDSSGPGTATLWARIYDVASNGRPGKLLIDFGRIGAANMLTIGNRQVSGVASPGFLLTPGNYFLNLYYDYPIGAPSPDPALKGYTPLLSGMAGVNSSAGQQHTYFTATGGSTTAGDTANVTGYAGVVNTVQPLFGLLPS